MKPHATTRIASLLALALLALPTAAQVKDYKDIKYPNLPDFKIPRPEVYTLDNGMKVFLMEDHEVPLINVVARIRTGSNYDPPDKVGLGEIFGQVQREGGTASMNGDQIDDFLEARAASIETSIGGDVGFASMNCLAEDFGDVFALFNDVLRKPVFAEDKIEVAKVQSNTGIARRNDSIAGIAGREFSRLVYGPDTSLGRMTEYATIAAITRDDLIAWHQKYYHPNNVYLGVVGDFDSAAMKKQIADTFGGWARGPEFKEPAPTYAMSKPGVYSVEKSDVTQAYVRIGHLGIRQDNPDYFAVQVMNEVLGGGFASRLFSNVRSKKGLAYSVGGGIGSDFVRPGAFSVGLSTKSETMAASVDALMEEVHGIIDNPPSKAEVDKATESILNSFIFNYTSRQQILGQQMLHAYYGLPDNWLATYRDNIEKVTGADVARVAKKYIHPDQLITLIVGKSADFDKPVASLGKGVTALDIAIAAPPDTRAKVERSVANVADGARLFALAGKKLGGKGDAIETVSASFDVTVKMGGQSMQLAQDMAYAFPDKLHTALKTPMGEQITVLNGEQGVTTAGGQSQALPKDRVDDSLKAISRDLLILESRVGAPGLETVAAGEDEVGGVRCSVVSVAYMDTESQLCIDASGIVIRQAYQGKHPLRGAPGLVEVVYGDYAEIDGRMVPRKRVVTFEGEEVLSMTLKSMQINPRLDPSMFEITK